MKPTLIWACAVVLTIALSVWQRRTGPTYAVQGVVKVDGHSVPYRLERSFAGPGDAPVRIAAPDSLQGTLNYRPAASLADWTAIEMIHRGGELVAYLPHQPIAAKLEYYVTLSDNRQAVALDPVVIRFRGEVPLFILIPHIGAMFTGFLFAARAGLAALNHEKPHPFALAALILIGVGGLILGPIVQKIGLGDFWTGWPFGPDLTDNKTLVAWLFWLPPVFSRRPRWAILGAIVTFLVFAIPHSVLSGNVVK